MNLSDDDKIALGDYCDQVLRDERFAVITNLFETATVQQLLSTKPQDRGRRDELFFSVRGVRDLLQLMAQLAVEKNRLLDPTQNRKELSEDELSPELDPLEDA